MSSGWTRTNYSWYRFFLKKEYSVLLIILLLCFGLRIFNFSSASLWVDEGYSLMLAHQKTEDIIKISVNDINPPLYGLTIRKWAKAFGYSHESIRFFSVICSLLTALVLYRLGRKFFNYLTAVTAALFFSLSNLQIYFAEEARGYAMVSMLCSISLYYLFSYLKHKKTGALVLLTIVNILVLHTHYVAGILFVAEGIVVLFFFYNKFKLILKYILSQAIVLGAFMPWFLSSWFKLDGFQISWLPELSKELVHHFFMQTFNSENILIFASAWIFISLVLFIFIKNRKKLKWYLSLFILSTIPLAIICFSTEYYIKLFMDRYILFCTVPMFVFLAYMFSSVKLHLLFKYTLISVYLYFALSLVRVDAFRNEEWEDATIAGEAYRTETTCTLLYPHFVYYTFDYYVLRWAYSNDYRHLDQSRNDYHIYPVKDTNEIKGLGERLTDRIIFYNSHYWANDTKMVEKFLSKTYDQVYFREFWGVRVYVFDKKKIAIS